MYKTALKDKVIELRKQKKSYEQISAELNIAKSTVSKWLKGIGWSEKITDELTRKSNSHNRAHLIAMSQKQKVKREKFYKNVRKEAVKEFYKLQNNKLFLVGLAVYWGEGDKQIKNCQVRISNTEPEMIRIFINFLTKICHIKQNKIKVWLLLYPDLIEKECKKYWQKKLGIKDEQFGKTQYIKGKHKTNRLNWGVGYAYIAGRELKERLLTWIELLGKMYTR